MTSDERRQIRHSVIRVLAVCPGRESREALAFYLRQEDEKTYKYEIYYANIAMQTIGEMEDIPLLEWSPRSRRRGLWPAFKNGGRGGSLRCGNSNCKWWRGRAILAVLLGGNGVPDMDSQAGYMVVDNGTMHAYLADRFGCAGLLAVEAGAAGVGKL